MGQIDTEESGLIGGETEHLLVTLREAVVAVGAHGDEDDRVVRRLEQPGRFDLAQRALQSQLDRGLSAERAYAASVTSMPARCAGRCRHSVSGTRLARSEGGRTQQTSG